MRSWRQTFEMTRPFRGDVDSREDDALGTPSLRECPRVGLCVPCSARQRHGGTARPHPTRKRGEGNAPESPGQNAWIESFNGRFRDRYLVFTQPQLSGSLKPGQPSALAALCRSAVRTSMTKRAGRVAFLGRLAQLVRAAGLQPAGRGFDSLSAHWVVGRFTTIFLMNGVFSSPSLCSPEAMTYVGRRNTTPRRLLKNLRLVLAI